MKNRISTLLLSFLLVATAAFADLPFRNHRYDGFKVLNVTSENIVFVGNSITNMHEWWEAFDNHNIINRGTSGAVSDELLANLESVIAGKPKKVFLMIGTNDLGTAGINNTEHVVGNLNKILDRITHESPATEVYVQSILPCSKDINLLTATNAAIREACTHYEGVTFIDLWDDLIGVRSGQNTLDNLHLLASGYRIWCKKISPYVGSDCVYQDSYADLAGGNAGSYGMRTSYFGMLPVKATDVLVIGDEMVHGGEWHELLHCDRVKNRGAGWGYPGADMNVILNMISPILTGNGNKVAPAKIFLYAGASEANGTTTLEAMKTSYQNILNKIREYAPSTKVFLMSLLPTSNATTNTDRVVPFNAQLQEIASAAENVEYVDIYTAMASGNVANTNYFNGNYVYGKGYAKLSQLLAPYLQEEGAKATTDEAAAAAMQTFTNRTSLMQNVLSSAEIRFGNGAGTYPESCRTGIDEAAAAANALLAKENPSADELAACATTLNNAMQAILPAINQPAASTEGNEKWHRLFTPLRDNRYLSSNGVGEGVTGEAKNAYEKSMWKFVERTDGKWNIVNRKDGSFLNPVAANNAQVTTVEAEPSTGWQLEYAANVGLYIIHAGAVELNQTQSGLGYKVYNWSDGYTGTDRNDTGCQYQIEEVSFDPVAEPDPLDEGWYSFKVAVGHDATMQGYVDAGNNYILSANTEYRQNATNYYSLKIGAYDEQKAPTAWLHLTKVGNKYRIQGLNGHVVNEYCISSRDLSLAPSTISGENPVSIDKWSYYNPADGAEKPYVGRSSAHNNTFSYSRIKNDELAGYDIYSVSITGAADAAEVGMDVSLTCGNAANKGIATVFNGGYFFFPKGTAISAADFTATEQEGLPSSISIADGVISVVYCAEHPVALLLQEAEGLLALSGVGYPTAECEARTGLREAVTTAAAGPDNETTAAPLREAIAAFRASTDLEMPQAGKAYTFTNVQMNGTTYALYAAADSTLAVGGADVAASTLGMSAVFVCGEADGKYYFTYGGTGNYLIWKGHTGGANDNSGRVAAYDADRSLFSIGSGNGSSFGTVYLQGTRANGNSGCFIISSAGAFNAWSSGVAWADGYSDLFRLEEVDYPNSVATIDIDGTNRVGVFSAPFPSVVPEGAKAYAVVTDGYEAGLTALDGNVVPAATGVAIVGSAESYVMVPAQADAVAADGNLLVASGVEGCTVDEAVRAYGLTAKDDVAFFTLLTDRYVAPNGAYLVAEEAKDELHVCMGRPTGIAEMAARSVAGEKVFDLSGRRVRKAGSGLYIVDGKKVLVK